MVRILGKKVKFGVSLGLVEVYLGLVTVTLGLL